MPPKVLALPNTVLERSLHETKLTAQDLPALFRDYDREFLTSHNQQITFLFSFGCWNWVSGPWL
jgi:hypothetical protein